MGFSPNVQTRAQNSQATPLANDVLRMIQGQLGTGMQGMGYSPLQHQAGTAIQQFVNSGGANGTPVVRDIGPAGANFGKMVNAMETVQNRRVNEQAANIREQAGAAGARYGTTLGAAEGGFRADAEADFGVQLGQLAMALDEASRADSALGIQRDLGVAQYGQNEQAQMLQAIMAMFDMGQQNMNPMFQLAGMGIHPEHTMVSPGIGGQMLSGFAGLAGGLGPIMAQWLMNRGQSGSANSGRAQPYMGSGMG